MNNGDTYEERKDYDAYRDDFMESLGITTLRFRNDEVMKDLDAIIDRIKKELLVKA